MRNALIYVFSGTGNTLIAANAIKEELNKKDIECFIYDVRYPFENIPNPNDYDVVGFGYPIHAFNTPKIFLNFVKQLPEVNNKLCFIFKTSGEPFWLNKASSFSLIYRLEKKNFMPIMDRHLLMPYNIWFRYKPAVAKQMYLHTKDMAKVIVYKLIKQVPQKILFNPITLLIQFIFRIQWLGARINGPLIHVKKDLCNGCGLCVKNCPAGNIKIIDGKATFGNKCTMCMNCALICPNDAVRPGLLNWWRINKKYPFEALVNNEDIPSNYINKKTKGYFRLFWRYYKETQREIEKLDK